MSVKRFGRVVEARILKTCHIKRSEISRSLCHTKPLAEVSLKSIAQSADLKASSGWGRLKGEGASLRVSAAFAHTCTFKPLPLAKKYQISGKRVSSVASLFQNDEVDSYHIVRSEVSPNKAFTIESNNRDSSLASLLQFDNRVVSQIHNGKGNMKLHNDLAPTPKHIFTESPHSNFTTLTLKALLSILLLSLCSSISYASEYDKAVIKSLKNGDKLYKKACASCHGKKGTTLPPGAHYTTPIIERSERELISILYAYRTGETQSEGAKGTMSANLIRYKFSDKNIKDIASYVASLNPNPPKTEGLYYQVAAYHKQVPEQILERIAEHNYVVHTTEYNGKTLNRYLIGPYPDAQSMQADKERLTQLTEHTHIQKRMKPLVRYMNREDEIFSLNKDYTLQDSLGVSVQGLQIYAASTESKDTQDSQSPESQASEVNANNTNNEVSEKSEVSESQDSKDSMQNTKSQEAQESQDSKTNASVDANAPQALLESATTLDSSIELASNALEQCPSCMFAQIDITDERDLEDSEIEAQSGDSVESSHRDSTLKALFAFDTQSKETQNEAQTLANGYYYVLATYAKAIPQDTLEKLKNVDYTLLSRGDYTHIIIGRYESKESLLADRAKANTLTKALHIHKYQNQKPRILLLESSKIKEVYVGEKRSKNQSTKPANKLSSKPASKTK